MRGIATPAALAALLLPVFSGTALPQEPAPEPPAAAEPAAPKPKPRPKPKPKPAPKAETPSDAQPERAAKGSDKGSPTLRTRPLPASEPPADAKPPASATPSPSQAAAPSPSTGAFAALPIACEPGQSVLYDGPKDAALWVTRSGNVTIDNPLRPLTPDMTRVLQIVVGGKLATAYGPDLSALRRGGSPAALEGALGGPIRWDKTLGTLPDTLNIVADSGKSIAELQFKSCGEAPAAAAPVAKARKDEKGKSAKKPAAEQASSPDPSSLPKSLPPTSASAAKPAEPAAPRKFNMPQGAIPQ